jgi:hypothetical protein
MDDNHEPKVILAGIGYLAVRRTIPEAIPWHKKLPHPDLSPKQVEFNRIPGDKHTVIENLFSGGRCY